MTNPADTKTKTANEPGDLTMKIGLMLLLVSAFFMVLNMSGAADLTFSPWIGLIPAFGLIVISYLQKIAAK